MPLLSRWIAPALIGLTASLIAANATGASEALTVELTLAKLQPSRIVLNTTGTIEAAELVSIAFQTSGRIAALHVETGDSVRQGEVLASIDPTQAEATSRAAQAQLDAAVATLTQAGTAFDRAKGLLERGATTRATLDTAEQQWRAATAQRDEAMAQLAKARQAVADTMIHAPASGIITARNGEIGQVVAAGQAIYSLARDGMREAQLYVPELPELSQAQGQSLQISTLASTGLEGTVLEGLGRTFTAHITEIAPLVDSATGTIALRAAIEADPETLSLGTPVTASLDMAGPPSVALPAAALVTRLGKAAVWIVTPDPADPTQGDVALREVVVSRFTSDTVELSSGVEDGEWVASAGAHLLFETRKVRIPAEGPAEGPANTPTDVPATGAAP